MNIHDSNHPAHNAITYEYAGFWLRLVANIIDAILWALISLPLLYLIYGNAYFSNPQPFAGGFDVILSTVLPAILSVVFWLKKDATPGKMLLGLKVLDANTGNRLTPAQAILRYFGYFVSAFVLFLGYIWVGIDKKKQGWHDKIAKTVVVRER
ncbi:RDD family protein [Moraxella sp. Tifton1]|uniref:RDD family protein n=1 Tax=Moraxella oculi TaxID=2940516 RepID=UPI002013C02D|nr:RDD family protein [Moraxella sp. Tifton1]MCL1623704.1 RDD family protein [Moraxella sp. Tifton1]